MTDRAEILNKAAELIGGERQQDYGSAAENFARIGNLWAEVLGVAVTPTQVALCMAQVKVARLVSSPDHLDSWVDGAGYLALGGEIATDGVARAFRELRVPRQWDSLDDVPRDVDVASATGVIWRWYEDRGSFGVWLYDRPAGIKGYIEGLYGPPFTEVIN